MDAGLGRDSGGRPKRKSPGRGRARILGIGPDDRKIYTKDPDARAGHRSAMNSRAAGPYIGYELHLVVETREMTWSDGIERVTIGPPVPPVITHFALTPAGSHRADAIVPELVAAKESGNEVNEVYGTADTPNSGRRHTHIH